MPYSTKRIGPWDIYLSAFYLFMKVMVISFIFVHDEVRKPLPFNIMVPQTRSAKQI